MLELLVPRLHERGAFNERIARTRIGARGESSKFSKHECSPGTSTVGAAEQHSERIARNSETTLPVGTRHAEGRVLV